MILLRGIFWGLFLWGTLCLLLPDLVMYWVLMCLGTLALIAVCVVGALFGLDWVEDKFGE